MTTYTAKGFGIALGLEAQRILQTIAVEVQGGVAKSVYRGVVENTPVLSGRARANWNVSLDAPDTSTTESTAGVASTGAGATAAEQAKVDDVVDQLRSLGLGHAVHIANSLDYVKELDEGSSRKAPSGIREIAIMQAKAAGYGKR